MVPSPASSPARDHRALAGPGLGPHPTRGHDPDRLPVRVELVLVGGHQGSAADGPVRTGTEGAVMAVSGASAPSLTRLRSLPGRRQRFDGRRVNHHAQPRPARALRVLYVAEAFGGGMFEITRMQAEGLARTGHQ